MRAALTIALAGLVLASPGVPAADDLVVIASTDPALGKGDLVAGAEPLSVAAGAEVTLLSSGGETIRLSGPYRGVPETGSGPSRGGSVAGVLSRLLKQRSASLAAFRGPSGRLAAGRPDVWGVDISRRGRYCLRHGTAPVLWWPLAQPGRAVVLEAVGGDAAAVRLRWPRNRRHVPWPDALPLASEAAYRVRFWADDPGEEFVVVLMPELATDAHRAAWMAEHGCERQALRVLHALAEGTL